MTIDLFRGRRSIRRYQARPISQAVLANLLEAAIWAPSAHNRQPWRFAVVTSDATKQHLAQAMGAQLRADLTADGVAEAVIAADVTRSYERITNAAALIVVCLSMADMDVYQDHQRAACEYIMAVQSCAMAGQNLLLAAHQAGLGACWMCAPLFVPTIVRDALRLAADWQPQGMITLGYPDQQREKTRHAVEQVTVWR
jgi:coenzyme F420-0:L-glutamate ligase / coenzyme F420-1:gamma-L-glutamate ligase